MKRPLFQRAALFALLLTLTLSTACTFSRGYVVSRAPVVVASVPPAAVYHNGHWLYYHDDGYYQYSDGVWIVASSVPTYVGHYQHPFIYSTPYYASPFYSHHHYTTRHRHYYH